MPQVDPRARKWSDLKQVLAGLSMLHVSRVVDPETDEVTLYATVTPEAGPPRRVVANDLGELVALLSGRRWKICKICRESKPSAVFGGAKHRSRTCSVCRAAAKAAKGYGRVKV